MFVFDIPPKGTNIAVSEVLEEHQDAITDIASELGQAPVCSKLVLVAGAAGGGCGTRGVTVRTSGIPSAILGTPAPGSEVDAVPSCGEPFPGHSSSAWSLQLSVASPGPQANPNRPHPISVQLLSAFFPPLVLTFLSWLNLISGNLMERSNKDGEGPDPPAHNKLIAGPEHPIIHQDVLPGL